MNPPTTAPPTKRAWLSRRRLLFGAGFIGMTGAAAAVYTRFVEPSWLEVTHHTIQLGPKEADPLRVLHLSDLHASSYVPLEFIAKVIQLGLAEKPRLICLTGDFITGHFSRMADYAEVLRTLSKAAPTFACLGNHDGGVYSGRPERFRAPNHVEVRQLLERSGVMCLQNEPADFVAGNRRLRLVGVGDLWSRELRAEEAFARVPPDSATLLLMHNPDGKDAVAAFRWHLALCGHTHGGQLRLPWFGTPFAPVRDHRYVAGLNRWRDRWIYTTRGVGNLHGVRFNCRPEVSLLTLS